MLKIYKKILKFIKKALKMHKNAKMSIEKGFKTIRPRILLINNRFKNKIVK